MREIVNSQVERLDFRQKYQLKNIKIFRYKKPVFRGGKSLNTEKMYDFYRGLQDRIRSGK
jgi:hypothetical protein